MVKRFLHKDTDDPSPKEKETIVHCLRGKNFPLQVLKGQKGTFSDLSQNLFTDWASIPRRYLGARRALGTPDDSAQEKSHESFDTDYPPLSDRKNPTSKTEKASPKGNNNNVKYLICAIVTGVLAGLGLVSLVIYFCVRRDPRFEQNGGLRDEKPLLNISPSNTSAGMLLRGKNLF